MPLAPVCVRERVGPVGIAVKTSVESLFSGERSREEAWEVPGEQRLEPRKGSGENSQLSREGLAASLNASQF